jgi:hypothetical protein
MTYNMKISNHIVYIHEYPYVSPKLSKRGVASPQTKELIT